MVNSYKPCELADLLNVSEDTLRRWSNTGKLECTVTLGGHRRYIYDTIETGELYEHQSITKHSKTYPKTYHWSNVPHEWLYESGYIHSYNKFRTEKILTKKSLRDYGLDGLSCDNNNYYGIQAKYRSNNKITASELGSFLSVIYNRLIKKNPNNGGFIYSNCDLQIELADDLTNNSTIKHIKYLPEVKYEKNKKNETEYSLKPFQIEAVERLDSGWNKNGGIFLPSGTGKTIILANHLRNSQYELVIVLSPIKLLTQQNGDRLKLFLPDYNYLLVDSDLSGTTDINYVQSSIDNNNKILISSTYHSAVNVLDGLDLSKFNYDHILLVIDEAHNICSNIDQFIQKFSGYILQLTATPKRVITSNTHADQKDLTCIYEMSMSQAIQQGFISDYRIYLPVHFDSKSSLYTDIPDLNEYYAPRAEFVANGMMLKGFKRLIAYFNSVEDCKKFIKSVEKVFCEYHGEKFWGRIITQEINQKNRNDVIQEFKSEFDLETYRIIASVRIMDEGIDIPKCDSIFIAQPGSAISDGSYRRYIQRLSRALRLDSDNPAKIAGCFLYCDQYHELGSVLQMLKATDPDFTEKIVFVSCDYDKTQTDYIKLKEKKMQGEFNKYIVTLMDFDERWHNNYKVLFEYVNKNKKLPTPQEYYKDINIGGWVVHQRVKNRRNHITDDKKKLLEKISGWKWDLYPWDENYDYLLQFVNKNCRLPSQKEKFNGINIGMWCTTQRSNKNKERLSEERINKLQEISVWRWMDSTVNINRLSWDENYNYLLQFIDKNYRLPKDTEEFDGIKIGKWCTKHRSKKKNGKLHEDIINKLQMIPEWRWMDESVTYNRLSWQDKYDYLLQFVKINKKLPSEKQKINFINIGSWCMSQRSKKKKGKLHEDRINKLQMIPEWRWTDESVVKNRYPWQNNYDYLLQFIEINGRLPKATENFDGIKIGSWCVHQRQKYKANSLEKDNFLLLQKVPGWRWTR